MINLNDYRMNVHGAGGKLVFKCTLLYITLHLPREKVHFNEVIKYKLKLNVNNVLNNYKKKPQAQFKKFIIITICIAHFIFDKFGV